MLAFSYRARDEAGRALQGRMEAASEDAVVERLRGLRYTIISIAPASPALSFKFEIPSFTRVKAEEYVMYSTQLSSMLSAGLPLTSSLDTLAEQTENSALRLATEKVAREGRAGASFAEALRQHPRFFPSLFINMIAAGEVAGNLEEVLERLSIFMEKSAEFRQKVATALFYPVVLSVFGVIVVVFIIITVLPTFVKMFKESGVPLPLPTLILYSTNLFIRAYWQMILAALFVFTLSFNYAKNTKLGKAVLDRIILNLPIWGPLARKVNIARFSRTLASLLTSGVPIISALETVEQTSDNAVFSAVAKKAGAEVSKGGGLAEQLKASGEFPHMPIKMVAVGEESGKLAPMLIRVADFYELSVDYAVKKI